MDRSASVPAGLGRASVRLRPTRPDARSSRAAEDVGAPWAHPLAEERVGLRASLFLFTATPAVQILILNCSPRLSDCAKAAISSGICSRSFRLTTSTGECM